MKQIAHGSDEATARPADAADTAQIESLKERVAALEARLRRSSRMRGRSVTACILVIASVVVLAGASVVYGQSAVEALFISPQGNVGIGTPAPEKTLHVKGSMLSAGGDFELRDAGAVDSTAVRVFSDSGNLYLQGGGGNYIYFRNKRGAVTATVSDDGRIADRSGPIVPVGTIVAFAGQNPPAGWIFCDGRAIPDAAHAELRGVLGSVRVPNLQGRTLIASGRSQWGTQYSLNQTLGEETHTMTINEMPRHNHAGFGEGYDDYVWPFGVQGPKGQYGSAGGRDRDNYFYNTTDTGGGQPFNVMQPSYVVNYIIKF